MKRVSIDTIVPSIARPQETSPVVIPPRMMRSPPDLPVRAANPPATSPAKGRSQIQDATGSVRPDSAAVCPVPWNASPRAALMSWSAVCSMPPA